MFHLQPATPETITTNLVHAAKGSDVDLVVVDGKIVIENGCLTTIDSSLISRRAAEIGAQLLPSHP